MIWYNILSWILFCVTLLGLCFYAMKHYIDMKFEDCKKMMDTEYRWIRDDLTSLERDVSKIEDKTKK